MERYGIFQTTDSVTNNDVFKHGSLDVFTRSACGRRDDDGGATTIVRNVNGFSPHDTDTASSWICHRTKLGRGRRVVLFAFPVAGRGSWRRVREKRVWITGGVCGEMGDGTERDSREGSLEIDKRSSTTYNAAGRPWR